MNTTGERSPESANPHQAAEEDQQEGMERGPLGVEVSPGEDKRRRDQHRRECGQPRAKRIEGSGDAEHGATRQGSPVADVGDHGATRVDRIDQQGDAEERGHAGDGSGDEVFSVCPGFIGRPIRPRRKGMPTASGATPTSVRPFDPHPRHQSRSGSSSSGRASKRLRPGPRWRAASAVTVAADNDVRQRQRLDDRVHAGVPTGTSAKTGATKSSAKADPEQQQIGRGLGDADGRSQGGSGAGW